MHAPPLAAPGTVVVDTVEPPAVNGAHSLPDAQIRRAPAVGAVAQLGERLVRNEEVGGSIPPGSTNPKCQ